MTDQDNWSGTMDKVDGTALAKGEAVSDAEVHNRIATEVKTATEESMRYRILKTIALYMAFAGFAFTVPILGMSIVHMEYILNTNTHTIAYAFTCSSIGGTVGGLICGLIFDRLNKEFVFSVSILIVGMTTIASGFVESVYAFMAVMFLQGLLMGFTVPAGQSYCINLWQNHRLKDPMLQAAHATWSLAAAIAPFVIRPFLIELRSSNSPEDYLNSTMADMTETRMDNVTFSSAKPDTSTISEEELADVEMARFAYLTIGLMIFCMSILFLGLYFYECLPIIVPRLPKDANSGMSRRTESQKQENCLMMLFLFMLFMFYFLYIYIEGLPLAYFTAFAIKHLGWSVHYATLLMPLFYGMLLAGRVVGVPLSIVLKPRTMVVMNLIITAVAYILLLFVNVHDGVMWVAAILSGFGMSSTFAAMILWVSETVQITGRVASVLLVGGSVGGMTGPLLVGQLFDAVSPMWMVYILVISSLLHITMFLILFFFVGKYKAKLSDRFVEQEVVHLNETAAVLEEKLNTEQS